MSTVNNLLARNILPDSLIRMGIRHRLAETIRENTRPDIDGQRAAILEHVEGLKTMPIAIATDEANEQHYEVPTKFYQLVLGKHLKYSSGYWPEPGMTIDQSESAMLKLTCLRAQLEDGQRILELGCGWGSLSLWMAENYPKSQITSVSNSR